MPVSNSTSLRAPKTDSSTRTPVTRVCRAACCVALCIGLITACDRKSATAPATKAPSAKEIETRLLRISEVALVAKKNSGLTAHPWKSLGAILPDSIGVLRAIGEPTGHLDRDVTKVSKATRHYASNVHTVKVEVMDVVEANDVLLAFMLQQAAADANSTSRLQTSTEPVSASLNVGPYPALGRYTPATRQSIITLAIAKRFILELSVTPSTGVNEALAIARTLPLGAFATLPSISASGEEPREIESPAVERAVLAK